MTDALRTFAASRSCTLAPAKHQCTGVVLAGGRGQRMSGVDKGLVRIAGRLAIEQVLDRLRPQVGEVVINANRNLDLYEKLGHPVVPDALPDFQGPLAGMLSAMMAVSTDWILTVPCDGPLLPLDLFERLQGSLISARAEIAIASAGPRWHPVYCLQPVALHSKLNDFMTRGGRRVHAWAGDQQLAVADFGDRSYAFANLNTPEDAAFIANMMR